ncbi:flagellar hook-basal body complex protein [uncultured Methylobacterium sp.]|mgnify:CR=1 FL=1|jgi:flagellar hook protein FlgE|uniref:flagellar hook protein FlgE n=1 Tax=uncultured Methylobacterium sp. TaxID=157278 RepID=UPI002616045B|nr:flagellar hook-basal body complex protein [uncultured Methylobacterium sp.]
MDIFSALQSAVSGLKAQSFALDNISGNIANSQTTGFKRIDTAFEDMLTEQVPRYQTSGSVAASSQLTNTTQGTITSSSVPTNMALNGEGFFVVKTKTSDSANLTTFSTSDLYTRRGDFSVDAAGRLVNGAGAYLVGQSLDPLTGQSTGTGVLSIPTKPIPARPTTSLTYAANLPATPRTGTGDAATAATILGALPGGDVRVLSGGSARTLNVAATDTSAFVSSSVAGGSLTAYNPAGSPVNLDLRWAKVAQANAAAGTPDTWNLFYATTNGATASGASWRNVGTAFTFNAGGQLASPSGSSLTLPDVTVDGVSLGSLTLRTGPGSLTQYADSSGTVATTTVQQDGYAAGTLNSLSVTSDGRIMGAYSNGNNIALARVGVVQFAADNGLKATSGGNYIQTIESGAPVNGLNGASIVGSNVEASNTDTSEEFSKLIVTQQAYSANTRVMSTAQQMMSDIINIIR